jgi:serine/threonine-protein kinase
VSAADFTPLLGEGYAFRDLIGQGGNGWVACMHQRSMDRDVAVKFLRDDLVADPEFRRRFEREAKAIGRLTHNHIVHVHDFVVTDNRLAIVMQYVDGGSLATRMRAGITGREALRILRCVADALDYAHGTGILHRDIKPHNILLQASGQGVWLADFGLVKLADGTALTATAGQMMGTYQYMAPELLRGDRATTATDIYALAATAYQVLVGGGNPFPGGEGIRGRDVRLRERPPVSLLPDVDAAAAYDVLSRALAEHPEERHATALELVDELASALSPDAHNRAPAFEQDLSSPLARLLEIRDDEQTRLDTRPPALKPITAAAAAVVTEAEPLTILDPVELPTPAAPAKAELGDVDQTDEEHAPRPRRSRRRPAAAIATTTGVLLIAGAAAAQLLPIENKTPPTASTPAASTLRAGAANFQGLAGTDASEDVKAIADKTIGDLQTSALTAAGTPANGIALALIDDGRTALTPAAAARGRAVDLADGGRGRRFTNDGVTTVIAQTPTQVVRLACTTPGRDCDRAIATLKIDGQQLQADPITDLQTKLAEALAQPTSSRRRLELPRRDLARRSDRARSIAKAYRTARDQVTALAEERPRDRDLPTLAESLDAAAAAFTEISDAARHRSTPGDRRGRKALATADKALRSSRKTLVSRGYTLTWPTTSTPAAAIIERRRPTPAQSASTNSSSSSTSPTQSTQPSTQQNNTPSTSSSKPTGSTSSSLSGSAFCDTGPC